MNKKLVLATMVMAAVTGSTFANGLVVGQVEPNTTAPVVSGYNSAALGVNTVVTGTSTIVLGRDNKVSGSDTTVIGANNGTVSANQTTIIGYNNKTNSNQEQVVIGANSETAGQGATVVGTHGKATAWDAYAIGNNTLADKSNSVALGTNSVTDDPVPTKQVVLNGVTHVFAGENPQSVVSVGSKGRAGFGGVKYYNRQITNVAAGQVDAASTDAVNGSQLYAAYDEIASMGAKLAKHDKDIKCLNIRVDRNVNNIKNLTAKVDNNYTTITNSINATNERVGANSKAIQENRTVINNHTTIINNHEQQLQSHEQTLVDHANVLENHENRIESLERGMTRNVDREIGKVGAANAALSALHYLGYNKDDKMTFSVGYGHYKGHSAVALGAFYAPNEHVMFSVGGTLGSEKMVNASVNFRLGKGSEYELNHKGKIKELETLVTQLVAEVETLKANK
ncbi:YadA-like family protein [uncultured Veillonella sp.]|uniref:YadA-like family protein n=1 Tax=uncultured Veillonella sp. TaxID=159268 RepID=UPI0025FBF2DF|nr:YadA-like family protein [uncultured Veillonella sp.]